MKTAEQLAVEFEPFALGRLQSDQAVREAWVDSGLKITHGCTDAVANNCLEAWRLLGNVARGIQLGQGRGDAMRVWAVTRESVQKLKQKRYRALLTERVRQVLDSMVEEARRDAMSAED